MSHQRDGRHDFDDEIGTWRTALAVLRPPLGGSGTWVEFAGTTHVSPVWGGAANLVQLDASGPAGELHALSLRLYDEQTSQWHVHFASRGAGEVAPPAVGSFDEGGRGEFRSREVVAGRDVDVRFVIERPAEDSWRFEQSFSTDGGASWETNWVAVDTRS
ncbi:hypothetical protein ACWEOW_13445 [Monashia sp. NPDC004114]